MSMIKNLKTDENGWFANGTFDSDSLFQGECSVSIFLDDGATVEDAEKCISHYNNLKNNNAFCEKLQKKLASFFLYMYDEWKSMGTYAEIVETCYAGLPSRQKSPCISFQSDTLYLSTARARYRIWHRM